MGQIRVELCLFAKKTDILVNVGAIAEGKFSYEPCTDIWFFNENYKNIQLFEDRQQVVN